MTIVSSSAGLRRVRTRPEFQLLEKLFPDDYQVNSKYINPCHLLLTSGGMVVNPKRSLNRCFVDALETVEVIK